WGLGSWAALCSQLPAPPRLLASLHSRGDESSTSLVPARAYVRVRSVRWVRRREWTLSGQRDSPILWAALRLPAVCRLGPTGVVALPLRALSRGRSRLGCIGVSACSLSTALP